MSNPALEAYFGNPDGVEQLGTALRRISSELQAMKSTLDGRVSSVVPGTWDGAAASAFQRHWQELARRTSDVADVADQLGSAAAALARGLRTAKTQFQTAETEADANRLQITPAFVVIPYDPSDPSSAAAVPGVQSQVSFARTGAEMARGQFRPTLEAAGEKLMVARGPSPGPTPVADRELSIPPPRSNPASVRDWWKGLTSDEQRRLIQNDPARIGALDGVPATVRDQANRTVLARERQRLQDLVDQGRPQPPRVPRKGTGVGLWNQYDDQLARWQDAQTKLGGSNELQARLDRGHPPAYLLGYDTNGPGHAIIAVNNPDTADNVVTLVPGVTSRLDSGTITYVTPRLDNMVDAAHQADPNRSTSAVMWLNYDAPPSVAIGTGAAAFNTGPARDGAPAFSSFEDGLRATHETDSGHFVALGHSYGSTLVGVASQQPGGLHVDDVILVGSPGVVVGNAAGLNVPGEATQQHVWVGLSNGDIIGAGTGLSGLGPAPAAPAFGAYRFQTDYHDHGHYWEPGSADLRNIGNIAVGKYGDVTPQPPIEVPYPDYPP